MQPPANERELIERAQHRDKEAIGSLYDAYVPAIFRYVSYRVESDAIAEDLTADVFLRMLHALPEYKFTGAPFGAWLFRIASHRIADFYREVKSRQTEAIPEDYPIDDTEPLNRLAHEEERLHLRNALQTLSEDFQNIILLRFMKEMSYDEVAAVIGKSEGAVRVMQHRALKALARELEKLQGRGEGRGDHA
jgi:RNA polymerase sigma-70 factor (ECF subfamily)